ncbi:MAG TPA: hypothetical protein VF114_10790 [Candidatus Limnocylindria bacterium]
MVAGSGIKGAGAPRHHLVRCGGKLDELAIYRKVLTAAEVTTHFAAATNP